MDNEKSDEYYIQNSLECIEKILKHTNKISYEEFVGNENLIDATLYRLIELVENINHISTNYKENHNNIVWADIVGFRNKIVHDYGKANYSIVFYIVANDLLLLQNTLKNPD